MGVIAILPQLRIDSVFIEIMIWCLHLGSYGHNSYKEMYYLSRLAKSKWKEKKVFSQSVFVQTINELK